MVGSSLASLILVVVKSQAFSSDRIPTTRERYIVLGYILEGIEIVLQVLRRRDSVFVGSRLRGAGHCRRAGVQAGNRTTGSHGGVLILCGTPHSGAVIQLVGNCPIDNRPSEDVYIKDQRATISRNHVAF
jgi:hypothetical protein